MEAGTYPVVQHNSAYTRDLSRKILKPLVIQVMINGHCARALVDSSSLGDFMSSTLAEQLKVKKKELYYSAAHPIGSTRITFESEFQHDCQS